LATGLASPRLGFGPRFRVLGDTRQSRIGLIVMIDVTSVVPVAIAGVAFEPRHWPARKPPFATVSFEFNVGPLIAVPRSIPTEPR
jgi:hypothetical protein